MREGSDEEAGTKRGDAAAEEIIGCGVGAGVGGTVGCCVGCGVVGGHATSFCAYSENVQRSILGHC